MTHDELMALLRPHPPGVPMPDHLVDALATCITDNDESPLGLAFHKVVVHAVKITEQLHGIRPQ